MVPLTAEARDLALEWLEPYPLLGRVSLRHALREQRPGLWCDSITHPASLLWVREAEGHREVFGVGEPQPALEWLAQHPGPLNLVVPENWEWDIEEAFTDVERVAVVTRRFRPADLGPDGLPRAWSQRSEGVAPRRLIAPDRAAFLAAAPPWALRGWNRFENLIDRGAAFGVPVGSGFGALAWTDATDGRYETIGLFTQPRYRRLGLGRAAATALMRHILVDRRNLPLWASVVDNSASLALASSLGLVASISEPLLRCSLLAPTS